MFAPAIPPGKKIVHATVDARDLNKDYVADVPILGDASLVLTALLEELRSQHGKIGRPERATVEKELQAAQQWKTGGPAKLVSDEVPINPYRVIGEFIKAVDRRAKRSSPRFGQPAQPAVAVVRIARSPRLHRLGPFDAARFFAGLAMGAKLACPGKLVVNFMGDTAFGMVGMDVETAVRERIPILTVLLNNSAMGNEANDFHLDGQVSNEVHLGPLRGGREKPGAFLNGSKNPARLPPHSNGESRRPATANRPCWNSSLAKNPIWRSNIELQSRAVTSTHLQSGNFRTLSC